MVILAKIARKDFYCTKHFCSFGFLELDNSTSLKNLLLLRLLHLGLLSQLYNPINKKLSIFPFRQFFGKRLYLIE